MEKPMSRLLFLSLLIFLAACSRGTTPTAAPASKPYTRPAPHDPAIAALVDQLANKFPPIIWAGGFDPDHEPTDAERSDLSRVFEVRQKLKSLGFAAFPDLVANADDPRYSYYSSVQQYINHSVGEVCFFILREQVDFGAPIYLSRDAPGGRYANQPSYIWTMRQNPGLSAWWKARRGRSLRELQMESLRWTIWQEESSGFINDAQRHQILDPLEKRLAELQSPSQTATAP
jgi:hypothetical protein